MKRLLRVSLDTALLSLIPVLSWFFLSIIVDKNLINVFTITYPLQFLYYMFKSVFVVGANISKERDNDKYAVGNGIIMIIILGLFVYGLIVLNMDRYLSFMNVDGDIYKIYSVYAVIQFYIQLVYASIIEKLYYEEKNKLANKYSITFNLLNFICLIGLALLVKDNIIIISITLIMIALFTLFMFIKEFSKFNFKFHLAKWLKYDSVNFFHNICFLLIFLFGLSNVINYGMKYALAISFVALITDTQWDVFDSINTIARVDIAKNKFNYNKSRNDAYKLLLLVLSSVFIMFIIFYKQYNLDIKITLIFLSVEVFNYLIYPVYSLKTTYLNIEWSAAKITTNKIFANIGRMLLSFLHTPYCTAIGQVASSFYQLVILNIIWKKQKRNIN